MAKMIRNSVILAKIETTEGTDAVPTGGANAILANGIDPQPLSAEFVDRDLARTYYGASEQLLSSIHSSIKFNVEMAASGTPGVAPAWAPLLKACAFAETITADTDAVYKPITENIPSISLYYYLDGILHKMLGARGTFTLSLSPKGIPVFSFTFLARYSEPVDASNPADVDFSAFQTPLVVNSLNTPSWSLHGYTGNLSELTLDVANNVIYEELLGDAGVDITDRKAKATAKFELGSVTAKNWARAITSGDTGALALTHGVEAGNIIQIDAPKVQLFDPSYSDSNDKAMLGLSLSIIPDTGNDELVITVK